MLSPHLTELIRLQKELKHGIVSLNCFAASCEHENDAKEAKAYAAECEALDGVLTILTEFALNKEEPKGTS